MKQFVSESAKQAFAGAIADIESHSAVEVVVAVRHHSGSYVHVDLATAIGAGVIALAVMLFAPWEFSTPSIFVDPLLVGALAGAASTQLPEWRRWLTRAPARRARVQQAARAAFYERRVRHTRERTGILVYLSLLERMAEAVPDSGVTEAVPAADWERARAAIERALRETHDGPAVARAMAVLSEVCAGPLPARTGDVNELPDEMHHP